MEKTIVMNRAWEIAREGVNKFGGQVKEYFSKALKIAWALIKKEEKQMKKVQGFEIVEENFTTNVWAKYGHTRIYVEGYFTFHDHNVNAGKRVTFKAFYDANKGSFKIEKGQARYEDMIKEFVKPSINEAIATLNDRNNIEEKTDFGMKYEGY